MQKILLRIMARCGGRLADDAVRRAYVDETTRLYGVDAERANVMLDRNDGPRYVGLYEPGCEPGVLLRTPFANWIDVVAGSRCLEMALFDFHDWISPLAWHYGMDRWSTGCVEVPLDDIDRMLPVLDYILAGEYSKKVEGAVFSGNEFLPVFSKMFRGFGGRFAKPKNDESPDDDDDVWAVRRCDEPKVCKMLRDVLLCFTTMEAALRGSVNGRNFELAMALFAYGRSE